MASKRSRVYSYVDRNGKPVIRFRFRMIVLIFILSFAACFTVYMMSVNVGLSDGTGGKGHVIFASENNSKEKPKTDKKDEEREKVLINPVPSSEPQPQTYLNKCYFVGDSITVGLSDYQYISPKNVIAKVGLNIDKINTETLRVGAGEKTALEALKAEKARIIYIMLGSNGIEWLSDDEMISYYSEFVDSVQKALPDSEIYILAIPPVTAEREKAETAPIKNTDIDKFNSSLLAMADKKKIHYVDLNTAMKGNDGKFPVEDAAEDGMHFNKETYQKMIDYILSHTVQ